MGAYNNLMREISLEDPQQFRIFLRMTTDNLEEILRVVGPLISKKDTTMREAISAKERLAVTLRFLATGKFVAFLLKFFEVHRRVFNNLRHNWLYVTGLFKNVIS